MALAKATIKADIKEAFTQVMNDEGDREAALDRVAGKLADAMISAIKSITITYTTGLTSATGGVVTGKFGCNVN